MTGGQPNPASGRDAKGNAAPMINFTALCKSMGIRDVEKVDAYDYHECWKVLKQATEKDELSVIITDRPCVTSPKKIKEKPLIVDLELCDA